MNSNKLYAQVLAGLAGAISLLQMFVPVLPNPWDKVAIAILAIFSYYNIGKSHSPAVLAEAGYMKRSHY